LDGTRTSLSTELSDGAWYFQIRPIFKDNEGNRFAGLTEYVEVVVDTAPPPAPRLISPGADDIVAEKRVKLDWNDVVDIEPGSGIKDYELQLSHDEGFSSPTSWWVDLSERTLVLGEEAYFWRVRALDEAGNHSDWSHARMMAVDLPPEAPVVHLFTQIPENWYKSRGALEFGWSESHDIFDIGYSWAFDNEPCTDPENQIRLHERTIKIENVADGTWYLHVKAVDNGKKGSRTTHFKVETPNPFQVVSPVDGGFVISSTPAPSWSCAEYVEDPLTLEITGPVSLTKTGLTADNYEPSDDEALPDGTYRWRVGTWLWSDEWQFVVDTDSSVSNVTPENG
jgi:hypothetical protein